MHDYPTTTLEFHQAFPSEDACREYLARLRWPRGFRCPRCGSGEAWRMQRGLARCRDCDGQTSLTAGTIFHETRKPLRLWFRAVWAVAEEKHGLSALGLQRALDLGSYRTAWAWMHKLRQIMLRPEQDRLTGTVEVDEASLRLAAPRNRAGPAAATALILVASQQDGACIERIRLRRLAGARGAGRLAAVLDLVAVPAIVRTDGEPAYHGLPALGYDHGVVREESAVGADLLPAARRVVALLEPWLARRHPRAIRPPYLDYYLDEFTFRFNSRSLRSSGELFHRLLQQAVAVDPVPMRQIRGGRPDP